MLIANHRRGQKDNQFQNMQLRKKSVFNLKVPINHYSEVFRALIEQDLDKLNISGLKMLEKNKEVVIKPADKGEGLVILNKADYMAEFNRFVNDQETYEKLGESYK